MPTDCPTPVVLLTFNRPETTRVVFEQIRLARPRHLFFVSDAPRPGRGGESEKVAQTRAIARQVDWPCEVREIFAQANMGCRDRVSSGISQALAEVDRAIILEDDCLPDPSWFAFATELLQRYEDDPQVLSVRGDNYQRGRRFGEGSYYFSKYATCWGWAVWRRSWESLDTSLADWPAQRDAGLLAEVCPMKEEQEYWQRIFDATYRREVNSWAYGWVYASFKRRGRHVTPNVNLIRNIGFDDDATHTHGARPRWAPDHVGRIDAIRHPASDDCSAEADRREFEWTHLNREPDRYRRLLGFELANRIGGRLRRTFRGETR